MASSSKTEIFPMTTDTRLSPTTTSQHGSKFSAQAVGDIRRSANEGLDACGWALVILSYFLAVITFPFSLCVCIKGNVRKEMNEVLVEIFTTSYHLESGFYEYICGGVVQEFERAVILRLGRILPGGAKGPGLFFILPCVDTIIKVDLRTTTFDVPPQEILTRDSVTVSVDAVVYSRIFDPVISVINVKDIQYSTRLLAQTTLRNILGTKSLQEILSDREVIAHSMQAHLDEGTDTWGVKVERVEITDVRLPQSMQRSMAAEAEASREARAKVIAAEGEQKASRQLKEAADIIAESPIALQLRYLQTLSHISAEKNSTIIFPVPIEFLNFVRHPM